MAENSFLTFLNRVRAGDQQAAAELVQLYEPQIRREVRLRLRDPRLRRNFDSVDICQSVLASFFVRASLGQYELDSPEHLIKLLVTMTRNKLVGQVRKQQAEGRDNREPTAEGHERLNSVPGGATPSCLVAGQELIQEFHKRMSPEEWQIAERRNLGRNWEQIAEELGGTAESRRKQLARAVNRVAGELGLDEEAP
jgi:RNA polymerase sigma-70 factor (ECF subfamily)